MRALQAGWRSGERAYGLAGRKKRRRRDFFWVGGQPTQILPVKMHITSSLSYIRV
jgi:hypothetical protein